MGDAERGESLIGVVVAVAVVATATTALLACTLAAVRHFGPDPIAAALERSARRELRIAVDLLKYQGASVPAASIATTIPLPSASPFAADLDLARVTRADGSLVVTVEARSVSDPGERVTLSASLAAPAPLPSALVPAARDGSAPE